MSCRSPWAYLRTLPNPARDIVVSRFCADIRANQRGCKHGEGYMSDKVTVNKTVAEALRVNEAKWSKPLIDAGWNAIPSVIIEKQHALGLDAIDMNIVVHLSNYWWVKGNLPRPSVKTIATAVGIKPRTVQKRIKALHEL